MGSFTHHVDEEDAMTLVLIGPNQRGYIIKFTDVWGEPVVEKRAPVEIVGSHDRPALRFSDGSIISNLKFVIRSDATFIFDGEPWTLVQALLLPDALQ
jgi:hypothetical protein